MSLLDKGAPNEGRTVIFFRQGGYFYPITLTPNCSVEEHARLNPGTIKVEDAVTREVLWTAEKKAH